MDNNKKFVVAVANLRPHTEMTWKGEAPTTEEMFNNIEWITGQDENEVAITTTVNPHSELTWEKVNAEMTRLQTEYDAQDYARKRMAEYPTIQEAVHAILDDDLENLQIKRQAVKEKYPK